MHKKYFHILHLRNLLYLQPCYKRISCYRKTLIYSCSVLHLSTSKHLSVSQWNKMLTVLYNDIMSWIHCESNHCTHIKILWTQMNPWNWKLHFKPWPIWTIVRQYLTKYTWSKLLSLELNLAGFVCKGAFERSILSVSPNSQFLALATMRYMQLDLPLYRKLSRTKTMILKLFPTAFIHFTALKEGSSLLLRAWISFFFFVLFNCLIRSSLSEE